MLPSFEMSNNYSAQQLPCNQ